MFSEKLLEEFYNPQDFGVIKGASAVGKIVLDTCNEIIKIYINVKNDVIEEAMFQVFGGVVAIACTNVAVKLIKGKTLKEAINIDVNKILEAVDGVPENKMYIVHAVVSVIRRAVDNYVNKN